ncbi:hypothetical protein EZS27_027010 [termite gut metagenome]|uniref:BACON domain-containing protein n=1 Tax=termite gut metagenome TaxID=433724 RepID=A0A5J4QSM4_9ZZZZ
MLYKKLFKLTMFLFVAGVLLSCNETDKPDAAPVLTIAAESLTQAFGQETGIKFVTVTSNQEFTATPNQTWVTADVLNTESSNLKITVEANTGAARSAEITVSAQGVADIKITVNQAAYEEEIVDNDILSINAEDENLEIALAGTTKFILVTASKAFTATSNKSWVEIIIVENNPEYNLTIAVGKNLGTERTALITLSAEGLPDVVITVNQARTDASEIAFEMTDWVFDTNGTWMHNTGAGNNHSVRKIFDEDGE